MTVETGSVVDGSRSAAPARPRAAFVAGRLLVFGWEFARSIGPLGLVTGGLLVLAAAATEGIGLALLAPLVVLLSENAGSAGWIGATVRELFAALGLPVSLLGLLTVFIGLIVIRAVLVGLRNLVLIRVGLDFVESWRGRLFHAIAGAGWTFLMRQRLSALLEALTSRIDRIGAGTYFFLRLPAILVVAAAQIAVALSLSPWLTLGVLCWGALLMVTIQHWFGGRYADGVRLADAHRAAFDEMSDFLQALKLAKSHASESRHIEAFGATLRQRGGEIMAFERVGAKASAATQIGAAFTLGAFAYLGVELAQVEPATLLVMAVIFSRLAPLASEFQSDWLAFVQMLPIFDSVTELYARCMAAAEPMPGTAPRIELRREIRIAGVDFHYDRDQGGPVIHGLDAAIPAGGTVAIVGATGAGKSTVADLLLGLIAPTAGEILIDGQPLNGPLLASWRQSVGYVPQDNFLFNDTVRANLSWGDSTASEADFQWALSVAAASEFIAALPLGLDTKIGERGLRLSGGERQRLGLARALLRRPVFLVLDEATSALDAQTERSVQTAIERLHGSITIVVIAHRLATVRKADLILVLESGRLVQTGTWETLSQDREGTFATLVGDDLKTLPCADATE